MQCQPAPLSNGDVVDRQAAHHHVERRGGERQITSVGINDVDALAYSLCRRVALGGGAAIAALITAPPQIRSHRPAARKPAGRQHQYRAAAASHVQDMLVTPQAQFVQHLRPD